MQLAATTGHSNFSSRRSIRIVSLLIVIAGLLVFAGNAGAASFYWTGGGASDHNWELGSNWNKAGSIPTSTDRALIGSSSSLHGSAEIKSPAPTCQYLHLGYSTSSNNRITHHRNSKLTVENVAYIGDYGTGTYWHYGNENSTLDVGGNMILGNNEDAVGTVLLKYNGIISTRGEYIGYNGTGTFNQENGTHTVGSWGMTIGRNDGSTGNYNLSSGTLSVSGSTNIGTFGTGTLTQTGGTAQFLSNLYMGNKSRTYTGYGRYNLENTGQLRVSGTEYIGYKANASFVQSDATSFHRAVDNVYIGWDSAAIGSYYQSNGRAYFMADEIVGYRGQGTVRQYNGTHAVTDNLVLGQTASGIGNFHAYGGTLSAGTLTVGEYGTGTLYQYGGTNTPDTMYLGKEAAAKGTYELRGTSAQLTADTAYVGNFGSGTFKHTAGTAGIDYLNIGNENGGYGSYSLSGSSSSLTTHTVDLGYQTTGKFFHQSGTHDTYTLRLGTLADGNGSYSLSGGNLNTKSQAIIGSSGTGYFLNTGGTHTANKQLIIGSAAGGDGTYSLNGGTLTGSAKMTVRGNADATGEFIGKGVVSLTGELVNNGKVTASYGGTLDLSAMSGVVNTIENDAAYGWYAENGAALLLPTLDIAMGSNSYNWGEDAADDLIDLVNSVNMDFDNVLAANTLAISLLDTAHGDVAAGLTDMLGVWAFDPGAGFAFDSVNLGFRFDDALLASIGGLNSVELHHYDGSAWNDITGHVDMLNHIVYGYGVTDFSNFAVIGAYKAPGGGTAIPEPATILLFSAALITLGGRALKRRRIR